MIPIDSAVLYDRSLSSLSTRPAGFRGRVVQIFLAAKYYGPAIPRVGSGAGVQVNDLQHLLDDFYRKNSRLDTDGSIAMIFQNNHLVPTGQIGSGLGVPSNIWRNNLGLQKATVCYGTEVELNDDAFLAQPRVNCPHLQPVHPGQLARARCELNLGPSYRNEDGPKAIRRDPLDNGFSIVSPSKIDFWSGVVAPGGNRLPVIAVITALYHDSDLSSGRPRIEPIDFVRDFNFSSEEYHAYFTDDPEHPVHVSLAAAVPGLTWTRVPTIFGKIHAPLPGAPPAAAAIPAGPLDPDMLPHLAGKTGPPAGGHWWSAEQAVEKYLRESGWNVINRTGQLVGFDLEVWRDGEARHRYVEVKSSVGQCSPVLTRNEYEAAVRYGGRYNLAILENYDPAANLSVLWVNDPAALPLRSREVRQYPIPRSVWLKGAGTGFG